MLHYFISFTTNYLTLVSLILSIFLFMNLSSRLYDISFNGDYPYIEKEIVNSLKEYEFTFFTNWPKEDRLYLINLPLYGGIEEIEVVK